MKGCYRAFRIVETEWGFYVQGLWKNSKKWYNAIEYGFGSKEAAERAMDELYHDKRYYIGGEKDEK